jgi:hypothetical protein
LGAERVSPSIRWRLWATALAFALPAPALAQGGPVFQLQPGLQVTDFVSVPEQTETNSAFSVRFVTRFPTRVSWLMPVVGASFLPYGTTENTIRNTDAPTLFAGNVFTLVSPSRTGGWLSIELPLLITHSPGAGPTGNVRDYGRDVVMAPTIYAHVGARGLGELGAVWSRLFLYIQLEQNLTPNRDILSGKRDYFNPIATFGASVRIGGPD